MWNLVTDLTGETIRHLEILGSKITSVEADSLAGCQVNELTLSNSKIRHVTDRSLRYIDNPN